MGSYCAVSCRLYKCGLLGEKYDFTIKVKIEIKKKYCLPVTKVKLKIWLPITNRVCVWCNIYYFLERLSACCWGSLSERLINWFLLRSFISLIPSYWLYFFLWSEQYLQVLWLELKSSCSGDFTVISDGDSLTQNQTYPAAMCTLPQTSNRLFRSVHMTKYCSVSSAAGW